MVKISHGFLLLFFLLVFVNNLVLIYLVLRMNKQRLTEK